jgi:hypothetical protein
MITSVKKDDGSVSYHKKDIMSIWKTKFESLYNPPATLEYEEQHYERIQLLYEDIKDNLNNEIGAGPLNVEILRAEVVKACATSN